MPFFFFGVSFDYNVPRFVQIVKLLPDIMGKLVAYVKSWIDLTLSTVMNARLVLKDMTITVELLVYV